MTTYKPKWYPSPIALPERRVGKFRVVHRTLPAGSEVPVVGMRQAVLRGKQYTVAKLDKPLRIHELVEDKQGLWMSDRPEELNQIGEMLTIIGPLTGRVLIGGLGLGILAQSVLAQRPQRVVVVERSKEVIALCRQPGYEIVQADIRAYLTTCQERFDFYLLDTWAANSEGTWFEEVMPLRRLIRNKWGGAPVIHCWAEDIMHAQLAEALVTKEPHWYYKHLPVPMSTRDARRFLRDVGLPSWERDFGPAMDKAAHEEDI